MFEYRSLPDVCRYQTFVPSALEDVAQFIAALRANTYCVPGTWSQLERTTGGPRQRYSGKTSLRAWTGSRAISPLGHRSPVGTISLLVRTFTCRGPSGRWLSGWRAASRREEPCSWPDTYLSLPARGRPQQRPARSKSPSKTRRRRSTPMCGPWSWQRNLAAAAEMGLDAAILARRSLWDIGVERSGVGESPRTTGRRPPDRLRRTP